MKTLLKLIAGACLLVAGFSPAFAQKQLAGSLTINGTAGNGYVALTTAQSSAPAAPAAGFVEYADSTGRVSWRRASDGFVRTFDSTLTANRVYTLPDFTGTIGLFGASTQTGTFYGTLTLMGNGTAGAPTYSYTARPTDGFYSYGANEVAFAAGGAYSMRFSSAGHIYGAEGSNNLNMAADGSVLVSASGAAKSISLLPTTTGHVVISTATDNQLWLDALTGGRYSSLYFTNNSASKAQAFWDNTNGSFTVGTIAASAYVDIQTGTGAANARFINTNLLLGGLLTNGTGTLQLATASSNEASGIVFRAGTTGNGLFSDAANSLTYSGATIKFGNAGTGTLQSTSGQALVVQSGGGNSTLTFANGGGITAFAASGQAITLQSGGATALTLASNQNFTFSTSTGGVFNSGAGQELLLTLSQNGSGKGSIATSGGNINFGTSGATTLNLQTNGTNFLVGDAAQNTQATGTFNHGGQKVVSTQYDATTTTLATVTGLSVTVVSGKTYTFRALLHVTADAVGGLKYTVAGTATATSVIWQQVATNAATGAVIGSSRTTALGTTSNFITTTSDFIEMQGSIVVNAGGTLVIQAAQQAANGTSSVLVGSSFIVFGG